MNLELDDKELEKVYHDYQNCPGDDSYFYNLANYLIEKLEEQIDY